MSVYFYHFILILSSCTFIGNTSVNVATLRSMKLNHQPRSFTQGQIATISSLSDPDHMNEILNNILIPRVVGTPQHNSVKNYIIESMKNVGWEVKTDKFSEGTPIFGKLTFENIIATLNPRAERYLTLACHYDSKYFQEDIFEGAIDSAVPCAQLINLAYVMDEYLKTVKNNDVSLMFIFFDGEEAFLEWNEKDSIYGARHLAKTWNRAPKRGDGIPMLERIDMLILLDLIGSANPKFYNYFPDTSKWYAMFVKAEEALASLESFEAYSYGGSKPRYFQPNSRHSYVDDDHTPFLRRQVSVVHLIPHPFPPVWHTFADNRENIHMPTIENLNKIFRVFVASYLWVNIHDK